MAAPLKSGTFRLNHIRSLVRMRGLEPPRSCTLPLEPESTNPCPVGPTESDLVENTGNWDRPNPPVSRLMVTVIVIVSGGETLKSFSTAGTSTWQPAPGCDSRTGMRFYCSWVPLSTGGTTSAGPACATSPTGPRSIATRISRSRGFARARATREKEAKIRQPATESDALRFARSKSADRI